MIERLGTLQNGGHMLSGKHDRDLLKKVGLTDAEINELPEWTEYTPEMEAKYGALWDKMIKDWGSEERRKWLKTRVLYDLVNIFHISERILKENWRTRLLRFLRLQTGEAKTLQETEKHLSTCVVCREQIGFLAEELREYIIQVDSKNLDKNSNQHS